MKKMKMITASILSVVAMAISMPGVSASAYELENYNDEIIVDEMSRSWTTVNFNVGSDGARYNTFSVSTPRYIYLNFSIASSNSALVSICRASDDNEVTSFVIPVSGNPGVTISRYLPYTGSYYFFISPYSGTSTNGSFAFTFQL